MSLVTSREPEPDAPAQDDPAPAAPPPAAPRPPALALDSPRSGTPVPDTAVAAMFDDIAPVYDRMNTLMTLGLDGGWRRAAVAASGLQPGSAAIDVACGTGL